MSEITLNNDQLRQAVNILWNHGAFSAKHDLSTSKLHASNYRLNCDDDDIHEYLVESNLLVQDHEGDTDLDPDCFQWLSDESLNVLRAVIIRPNAYIKGVTTTL